MAIGSGCKLGMTANNNEITPTRNPGFEKGIYCIHFGSLIKWGMQRVVAFASPTWQLRVPDLYPRIDCFPTRNWPF